jgi:hypothetical protein
MRSFELRNLGPQQADSLADRAKMQDLMKAVS